MSKPFMEARAEMFERLLRELVETLPEFMESSPFYRTDQWRSARAALGLPVARRSSEEEKAEQ